MIDKNTFLLGNPGNFVVSGKKIPDPYINSRGYRAPEFDTVDWTNSIVIFGCSYVYGNGISIDETISAQLEDLLNQPVINMGVPASSIAFSFINQLALAEQGIIPYAVVNCWTSMQRVSYFSSTKFAAHLGPWIEKYNKTNLKFRLYKKIFDLWNFENSNPEVYSTTFRQTAKILWKHTKHLEYSFFPDTAEKFKIDFLHQTDFGGDNSHPGVRTAFETAKIIAEDLEKTN